MIRLAVAVAVAVALALLIAPAAFASDRNPTLNELENEVMCPVCSTTLAQSNSDAARAIEREIQDKINEGWTKGHIKDFLVQQYGESILAAPPKHGFNLLAWVLPLAGIVVAASSLGIAAWRWSRGRTEPEALVGHSTNGQGPPDPELDRRVDEELARFE
jgi:cytochrome c-type biogenesis protein CcmH